MSTKEVLQYKIHQMSEQISQLKTAAFKSEKSKEWPYGYKIVSYMNPSHPDWQKYRDLKSEASKFLTALVILKEHPNIPDDLGWINLKKDFRKEIRAGKYRQHLPKGKDASGFLFEQYYFIQNLEREIKAKPAAFKDAEIYAQQRKEEAAKRKAEEEANVGN